MSRYAHLIGNRHNPKGNPNPGNMRPCIVRDGDVETRYPSVAAVARALGMKQEQVHGMLSGRCGKRSRFKVEYAEGV